MACVRQALGSQADLAAFIRTQDWSSSTINRFLAAWKSYARYTRDKGLRDQLEEIDRPKRHKGLPRPVPDWRERIAHSDTLTRAVVTLFACTGLRLHEATSLDVGPPWPWELHIVGKGGRERDVPLDAEARRALIVLGGRMPWSGREIERRCRQLGFTPHMLRHTYACELTAGGADIKDVAALLGHASTSTTEVYSAYSPERLRAASLRRRSL